MRILLVNTYDNRGGASIASLRLLEGLLSSNVDASLLVQEKRTRHDHVIGPESSFERFYFPMRPYLDFIPSWLSMFKRKPFFPAMLGGNLVKKINDINPDIVHLNWVCGGLLAIEELAKIDYPVVWSLHDMWPFTGGCHNAQDCKKFEKQCGACPHFFLPWRYDLSRFTHNRKQKVYKNLKLHITSPSSWLTDLAKRSSLLRDFRIRTIPNMLDTDRFLVYDKTEARRKLQLKDNKLYLAFGAIEPTSNPLKGYHMLTEALESLNVVDVELLVFGTKQKGTSQINGIPVKYFGFIENHEELNRVYSAADVMVVPSFQESFGQTLTEAMASGTPVVAFNATGPADIIDHMQNGYLAKAYDTKDLAKGIKMILEDGNLRVQFSRKARKTVEDKFSYQAVVPHWIDFYHNILNEYSSNEK